MARLLSSEEDCVEEWNGFKSYIKESFSAKSDLLRYVIRDLSVRCYMCMPICYVVTLRSPIHPRISSHGDRSGRMSTAITTTARPPAVLNLSDPVHKGENWKRFERAWKNYALAAKLRREDRDVQVATLLNVLGDEAFDLYDTFTFDAPDPPGISTALSFCSNGIGLFQSIPY